MRDFLKKVPGAMCQTWVWSLALVVACGALVWWGGPTLAINDVRVLASALARLLAVCALLLLWGAVMLLSRWWRGRPSVIDPQWAAQQADQQRLDNERRSLHKRFAEALRSLRHASLFSEDRQPLPWYLLIGPQGSGKSRLLACSGLEFALDRDEPLTLSQDHDGEQCQWYFTDQAVLIDTPGRYLAQADASVDGGGWRTLLELLRKRRRARPLDGVLITVAVPMLLEARNPELGKTPALLELISQIRQRLQEVRRHLQVQVPVYLVLSKADQLPGFNAFFDSLSREQNSQALGVSFSAEQPATDRQAVHQQIDALLRHLDSQLIGRLHQQRDKQLRSRMLDFPPGMAALGEQLEMLIDQLFFSGRYVSGHRLSGVYLTCASAAEPESQAQPLGGAGGAQGRFVHELFARVILREAHQQSLAPSERQRIHWGQRLLLGGGLATLMVGGALWTSGFSANHQRLETLRRLAGDWQQQRQALDPAADAMTALKTLDISWQATQVFPDGLAMSWHERNGLYQGWASNPLLQARYEDELRSHLLPRLTRLLEARVRSSLHDREALLDNLRAYLMLHLPTRRDPAWLEEQLGSEWARLYPGHAAVQQGLGQHVAKLLKLSFSQPLDEPLVAQARQALRNESQASLAYKVLRERAGSLPDYRLGQHLGPQRELFVGAEQAIPGFFTRQGYRQFFSVQSAAQISELLRDNWVLGEGSELSGTDMRRLLVELEQLYFRDYASHWSDAVGRLGLLPFSEAGEGADLVSGLLSANSPVVQLLAQIRDNTRFPLALPDPEQALPAPVAGAALQAAAGAASKALVLPENARKAMQLRFEPLHRLLDDNDAPTAELVAVLQGLDAVQQQLASLARASQPEPFAYEMARARMAGQRDALSQLRNTAARLPRPVGGWFNLLADDAWRLILADAYRHLDQRYQSELYAFYSRAIDQRYPFHAHSSSDVALNDFREFFKAQGVLERFFEQHLKAFVSGSADNYRLRSIDGHSLPMSRAVLEQIARGQRIRQGFFAEDPSQPQVRFRLEPYSLDSGASRAEFRFGERRHEYRHGPIVPMTFSWPDEAGQGSASLLVERMAGRTVGIEKNLGPWSLFRLLDLMPSEPLSGRDVLLFKADVGGLRANYLLTSQRMPNPLDLSVLRGFRLPAQL
ncbi:type VI secretion system membrane subunit TssM [Pseudomonas sp. 21LCFQ010]|uniref:type VI secretion system membrane subunit TssM n=1 Tax=Pseudomonas sp. 21LCFQ010 TaxID=2957506 RepID=UPI002096FFCE|nr:type VI secretion system membrane subunit TssM [Pseudomonas sp. 21LCFQ010]MCO8163804.1 type VI secretion system membrane subunit TssM [Pseudomonas sp. 21LCFQ010]